MPTYAVTIQIPGVEAPITLRVGDKFTLTQHIDGVTTADSKTTDALEVTVTTKPLLVLDIKEIEDAPAPAPE